jgi:uncharacterized glyoxalase superfamily protein PhnB
MSGKTIGSKKDADRQQANTEKEQSKQDREKYGERMHGSFRVKANVVMISDGFC